ncbi:hypothetical protein Tco_1297293 [Tanacetum coccineum]
MAEQQIINTAVTYDPFPPADETKQRPLREFLIKFSVLNEQRPLTLDFKTFSSSTGLDYNNGKYVAHPTPEPVKKELGKITINPSYLDKTSVLKNSFPVAWRSLFTFMIQVLGSDYTQDEIFRFLLGILSNSNLTKDPSKVTSIELTAHMIVVNNQKDSVSPLSLVAKPKKGKYQTVTPTLPKSQGPKVPGALSKKSKRLKSKNPPIKTKGTATHPKDSGGNIQPLDRDLTSMSSDKGTAKTTPRPEGSLRDKDSGENIPPVDMEPIHLTVVDLSGTGAKYQLKKLRRISYELVKKWMKNLRLLALLKHTVSLLHLRQKSLNHLMLHPLKLQTLTPPITEDNWEKHKEVAVNYADLKASIDDYYDENIAHIDQTDKLVEASMSYLDKSSNTISDLNKGLNIITKLLKEIKNVIKDDSAHALKQDEELAAWAKSSTNMAWNLGSRLSGLEQAQNHIQSSMSSLKEDTHSIKTMMTKMYEVFKGQSSGSVTPTLSLTHISVNVKGENATNTTTEEPPSYTEGETKQPKMAVLISSIQPTEVPPTQAQPITIITTHPESSQASLRIDKGKGITTESDEDPLKNLVPASTIVCPDPDEEVKVSYMINGKMCYLTDKEMQAYLDSEEKLSQAAEEERLLAISKPEVIKVVQEEAENIGLDPKKIASAKAGEKFKKA